MSFCKHVNVNRALPLSDMIDLITLSSIIPKINLPQSVLQVCPFVVFYYYFNLSTEKGKKKKLMKLNVFSFNCETNW